MKTWNVFGFALFIWMTAGCASTVYVEKSSDVQLSAYQTYNWIQKDTLYRKLELLDHNVKSSGDRQLAMLGYRRVDKDPDLLFDYDVLVEKSRKRRSETVYMQPYFRMFYNPYTRFWGTIYFPAQFVGIQSFPEDVTEGTITLTVVDVKSNKTIWQGWSTDEVNSRNLTAQEVERSIRTILKKFH